MKTIGFFGDSFCAGREPESWCVLLANQLNAGIVHWGEPGRSIWSTFFKFNQLNGENRLPDICVLCYTEPYRLYHPSITLAANTEPVEEVDTNVYKALEQYWIHLHNYDKDELSYEYALKWFDYDVLSKIKNKTIVQMWSFRPFETAGKDANIKLTTGIFINESMMSFSKEDCVTDNLKKSGAINLCDKGINHMTIEQNKLWADKVYKKIKEAQS